MTPGLRSAVSLLTVVLALPCRAEPVTAESLLEEMVDRAALAEFPEPAYRTMQASSYDRRSTDPSDASDEGWFANADAGHFIRVEERAGRREHVLMEADGPGAVVRIWSANPAGTLRVYLDGADEPLIEEDMAALLGGTGSVPEPFAGVRSRGYNLYLPIPFAESCKVTSDAGGFYYHVNWRRYDDGADVRSLEAWPPSEETLAVAGAALEEPFAGLPDGEPLAESLRLGPGERVVLSAGGEGGSAGSGVVRALVLMLSAGDDTPEVLRSLVLSATFDGRRTVWTPVGDFFGSGVGLNEHRDFFRMVNGGPDAGAAFVSAWAMPFERSAEIAIENLGEATVHGMLVAAIDGYAWTERSMHFHAVWRQEREASTLPRRDFNYAEVRGKGVLVGDQLTITNPVPQWWGEGDEKIYVDGEAFPSHFGTGTEDYYGYAWCDPTPFRAAFHGQPQSEGAVWGDNYGISTVSRVRTLDAVPFGESLRLDMELWHWAETRVALAATAFFYARPGAGVNVEPMPEEASAAPPRAPERARPWRRDGAAEAEGAEIVAQTPGVRTGVQGGFPDAGWSNGRQLWVLGEKDGDFVELAFAPEGVGPGEERRLSVVLTRSWDYGVVGVSVNGRGAGEPVDTFNTEGRSVAVTEPIDLGVHAADGEGRFVVRFEVVGSNPASEGTGRFFGVDCVVIGPAGR